MKRIYGMVRWYDRRGQEGVLIDFDGNEWYFNSWSFPKTHYRVTGICKKTGRKKTISTRRFPGLWINYKVVPQKNMISKMDYNSPVSFTAAKGLGHYRWAVDLSLEPKIRKEVLSYRLATALESWAHCMQTLDLTWLPNSEENLSRILLECEEI